MDIGKGAVRSSAGLVKARLLKWLILAAIVVLATAGLVLADGQPPLTIAGPPTVISTATVLPASATAAATKVPFSQTFTVTGGVGPYTWSLAGDGVLPEGLTLDSSSGEISGTPTAIGLFPITVQVTDSTGAQSSRNWTLSFSDGLRAGWPRELQARTGTGNLPESYSPIIADLDGDGKDEVITADQNTLYVHAGDGSVRKVELPGTVTTPAVADLDGDGQKEIIVSLANPSTTNMIYAFHADLTPVAGFPAGASPRGLSGYASSPAVEDFDYDGTLKIAVVTSPADSNDPLYGQSIIMMVDSQGQMVPGWPQYIGAHLKSDAAPAVGDLHHYGKRELVLATLDGYITTLWSDGSIDDSWLYSTTAGTEHIDDAWPPVLADLNGDGFLDVVVKYHSASGNYITALDGSGYGNYLQGWPQITNDDTATPSPCGVIVADVDGDGYPEVVTASSGPVSTISAYRAFGAQLSGWTKFINPDQYGSVNSNSHPIVADINGDGVADVLVTTTDVNNNSMLLAFDGMYGQLLPGFPKYVSVGSQVHSTPAIGDVDGNGNLDLVVRSEDGFLWSWEMPQPSSLQKSQWPMFRRNPQHTAAIVPNWLAFDGANPNFSTVAGTSSQPQSFTVGNWGDHAVPVSIVIDGVDSSLFTMNTGTCGSSPFTLGSHERCTFYVTFSPSAVGFVAANLLAMTTDPTTAAAPTVYLEGNGMQGAYQLNYTKAGDGQGTVTSSTGTSYSNSGSESAAYGSTVVLSATPAAGSIFTGWGGACNGTGDCSVAIYGDTNVSATFAIGSYNITATAGANGAITGPASATRGGSASYTITAATGYHVADVLVDGVSVGAVTSYSFTNVTASHTISASFAINSYNITLNAGPNGSISGPATATYSARAEYSIIPATGYQIAEVVADGHSVGTVSTFAFVDVQSDHTLSATFAINSYQITATADANGSISGPATANYGATATYSITPATGYHVSDVLVDGVSVGAVTSYSFSSVSSSHTISASFAINRYTVTPTVGPNGSLSGPATVEYGASATYTFTPASGYRVSNVGIDGASIGPVSSYSFTNVTADHTVSVFFEIDSYTISIAVPDHGSISGPSTVLSGGSATYTMTPAAGYHLVNLVVDGQSLGVVSSYTFSNVTANHIIGATFAPNSYTIAASSTGGGTMSGYSSVTYGDSDTFTMTPLTGYHVADVVVDGVSVGAVTSYSFSNVTADHTISANFAANSYNINATAGANGSISGPASATYGGSASYSITPAAGYHVADVVVDGVSVGAVTSYSFTNITANHAISATFAINSYSINATAGANGSISGPASATYGGSASYSITPSAGYRIADVVVDGASVGAVSSYSFANVTANHTISASFIALADLTITSVTSPTNATRGRSISVSAGVANQGGGNAGSFNVAFYLSLDGTVNSGDVLLGTQTVSSLNAGGTTTVNASFTVPSGMASGKYYVIAVADYDAVISESNENNNTMAAASTTTIK